MYILGLESSCDETSAAIVEMDEGTRRICANIIASQIDIHRLLSPRSRAEHISKRSRASLKKRSTRRG